MEKTINKKRAANRQIGRFLAVILISLALTFLICALLTTTIYAANTAQVTFTVEQVIVSNGSQMPSMTTFTYRLAPKTTGASMPYGSNTESFTFTITGTGERIVGPINFNTSGIFVYELSCITDNAFGFIIDRRVYTIEVHVTSDLQITMVIYNSAGAKVPSIYFEHTYWIIPGEAETPNQPGTPSQPGQPTLQGRPETPYGPETQDRSGTQGGPDTPGHTGTSNVPGTSGPSPKTGDFSNPTLWITLITISGTLLLLIVLIDRKLKRGREN